VRLKKCIQETLDSMLLLKPENLRCFHAKLVMRKSAQ
jgi:hypothetical protein